MRLSKRRAKAGAQSTTNAVLVCKHRDMNEKELEAQVSKMVIFLMHPVVLCELESLPPLMSVNELYIKYIVMMYVS